jgi:hypothetical protein
MFEGFFDTAEVDRFADWVIGEFKRELPSARHPPAKDVSNRANKLDQVITNKTGEFVKTAKLNIYKKARFASRVRDGLRAQGYTDSFVKSITYNLISRVQKAKN